MLANQATNWFVSGVSPTRMGNAHPNLVPYQPFPCRDGSVVIAVGNDNQYRTLCGALGVEGLAADDRYLTNAGRIENRVELASAIAALTSGWTMRDLIAALEAAGVPCGPINTVEQVFAEPQALHRELEIRQARADLSSPARTVANPMRLSVTPVRYAVPPPRLGQNTEEVLAMLDDEPDKESDRL
jgi:crotonobetainyl-CoA:carnitine CoA-transferase CaiB-like acyl-CoA transferase